MSLLTYGQINYKPKVVVLDPYQTKYDPALLKEIEPFSAEYLSTPEEDKHYLDSIKNEKGNIQKMKIAEWEFRKKMDFGSEFSLSLDIMLMYFIFGETDKCLVFPSHDTSNGQISSLKNVAKRHDVLWVVNPLLFQTYLKDGNKYSKAVIQVYDVKKNKIVLTKEYTGDTKSPGFELSCETGTLECTINNILNPCLNDVILSILKHYQH